MCQCLLVRYCQESAKSKYKDVKLGYNRCVSVGSHGVRTSHGKVFHTPISKKECKMANFDSIAQILEIVCLSLQILVAIKQLSK